MSIHEKYIEQQSTLTEADFQWVAVSSTFHAQTPSYVIDEWVKNARRNLVLEAFTTGWIPAFCPEVLRATNDFDTGVRIRVLVTRLRSCPEDK